MEEKCRKDLTDDLLEKNWIMWGKSPSGADPPADPSATPVFSIFRKKKTSFSVKIDQITPPLFVKHVLLPQHDFDMAKIMW